jgi:glyoxylase-like metal-dependent hydrolase (beta-lactamase superfamily II)
MEKMRIKDIEILKFTFNPLRTNCYLINLDNQSIIIDPSNMSETETEELVSNIRNSNLHIFNTHGHFDHIAGNSALKKLFKYSKIIIHKLDCEKLSDPKKNMSYLMENEIVSEPADVVIDEDFEFSFGILNLKVVHTPGHTKGSVSIIGDGFVFTGDTLLEGTVGIAKEYPHAFEELISSIKEKLLILNDDFIVLGGHGEPSTIGEEKAFNPFLS